MRRREAISKNREIIDNYIREKVGDPDFHITPRERELWTLNDPHLYVWINEYLKENRGA